METIQKQFVTYEIAFAMKELGFDEECFGYYRNDNKFFYFGEDSRVQKDSILSPLWQQCIDWFREKHSVHIEITCANFFDSYMNNYSYEAKCKVYKNKELDGTFIVRDEKNNHIFYSYEDARKQAILKAIEFIKSKRP